ncbi:MAG: NADH-quinone oxidoreductase subunit L [Francisella sp.]|jgi:NADH-quinone oxidoreductase subunit L|nr:MAG: NADH-quinone oxidoreductase subunit L [Francisella sp.]
MGKMALYLLIVLTPLVGSLLAGLCSKIVGRKGAHTVTIIGLLISTILSCYVLGSFINGIDIGLKQDLYTWLTLGNGWRFSIGFWVDELTALMMTVVTSVSLMVHIYTIGYMKDDPGYQRFFSYISLFTFAMLVLVMSNNFVQLFFGWEAVGLVSYLLIGFWFKKPTAIFANLKAFLINRIGDLGFLIGIGLILAYLQSGLEYGHVFFTASQMPDKIIYLLGIPCHLMSAICLFLFVGAMGKSAQFPLHVWLPDSMEGPTPISALIHAATMVTAGIFMVARMSPLYELSNTALNFVLGIGSLTALLMGFLGMVQNDIKRVVAYSTLSQLGYMVAALGVSAYPVAIFHVMTHAFFKALLFLAAGSVIIGMHHDQDMRYMGGLYKYMPITWITMLIGTLSLVGTPFFSGFYSKESIIEAVGFSTMPWAKMAYWMLLISVFVTSFYSFRLYFLVFHGKERWKEKAGDTHHIEGKEHHGLAADQNPKESPLSMILPLILLAIPSIVIGYFTINPLLYGDFLSKAISINSQVHPSILLMRHHFEGVALMAIKGVMHIPFYFAIAGFLTAFILYHWYPSLPQLFKRIFYPLYVLFEKKYYMDTLYYALGIKGAQAIGRSLWKVGDVFLIDTILVNGSAKLIAALSGVFRKLQTGYIYTYATAMVFGLLLLIVYWFYPVILKTLLS